MRELVKYPAARVARKAGARENRYSAVSLTVATFADGSASRFFARRPARQRVLISDAAGASLILILSDINMPGMTGLELLPRAKAARPDVPVIMITAYGDDSTRRKALEGGAEALLTKPIDFVALRCEIDGRVNVREPHRSTQSDDGLS